MAVRCGNRNHSSDVSNVHHHETIAQVRLCFVRLVESLEEAEAAFQDDLDMQACYEAERAYEYFLETRYADQFRWEEDYERQVLGAI